MYLGNSGLLRGSSPRNIILRSGLEAACRAVGSITFFHPPRPTQVPRPGILPFLVALSFRWPSCILGPALPRSGPDSAVTKPFSHAARAAQHPADPDGAFLPLSWPHRRILHLQTTLFQTPTPLDPKSLNHFAVVSCCPAHIPATTWQNFEWAGAPCSWSSASCSLSSLTAPPRSAPATSRPLLRLRATTGGMEVRCPRMVKAPLS